MTLIALHIYWVKMDVANLLKRIEKNWESRFSKEIKDRNREWKTVSDSHIEFRVLFDPGREKIYRNLNSERKECPFDKIIPMKKDTIKGDLLFYGQNIYPYFDHQFMAFPIQHRCLPTKDDLNELIELTKIAKNYTIMMNMEGAGANIPEHIHYQCIRETLPIDKLSGKKIKGNNHFYIEEINYTIYALRLKWNNKNGQNKCQELVLNYNKPINLYIYNDRMYMIPRTANYPQSSPNTKIGCAEVGGLFLITSREIYDKCNFNYLENMLKEVTICKPK
jgi:hypothetical protein